MKKLMMIMAMVAVIGLAGTAHAETAVKQDESTNATGYYAVTYAYGGEVLAPGDGQYGLGDPTALPEVGIFWTPGLTGSFDVDVSWAAGHTAHGPVTSYYFRSDGTAGSEVLAAGPIDQENLANGVFPVFAGTQWSGWYDLGEFALNPSSTFRAREATNYNVTTGMWRFSDPGSIRQEDTAYATGIGSTYDYATGGAKEPEVGDNKYGLGSGTDMIWTPGLTGKFSVDASWAAGHTAHGPNTAYYFDPDGAGAAPETLIVAGIDQENLANGGFPAAGTSWSGFYELGTFDLTPSSEFRINGATITTGVWQFTPVAGVVVPEPAGLGLIGLALLAVRRKRS